MFIPFTRAPGACQVQLLDGCIRHYINDFRRKKLRIGIEAGFSTSNLTVRNGMI
jgi:hypothetical protein